MTNDLTLASFLAGGLLGSLLFCIWMSCEYSTVAHLFPISSNSLVACEGEHCKKETTISSINLCNAKNTYPVLPHLRHLGVELLTEPIRAPLRVPIQSPDLYQRPRNKNMFHREMFYKVRNKVAFDFLRQWGKKFTQPVFCLGSRGLLYLSSVHFGSWSMKLSTKVQHPMKFFFSDSALATSKRTVG